MTVKWSAIYIYKPRINLVKPARYTIIILLLFILMLHFRPQSFDAFGQLCGQRD